MLQSVHIAAGVSVLLCRLPHGLIELLMVVHVLAGRVAPSPAIHEGLPGGVPPIVNSSPNFEDEGGGK